MLKGILLIDLKKLLQLVKSKISYHGPYAVNDLNGEEIDGKFYENELQKTDQKEFRVEKVIKRKGDKLYIKWKGHDDLFNSWIDKKDVV